LKLNLSKLKVIYLAYSGKNTPPGEPDYMSMEEFFELFEQVQICSENFGTRECGIIFSLSMGTQVDEVHANRHTKMTFVEFLEAYCRVADKLSKYDILRGLAEEEELIAVSNSSYSDKGDSDDFSHGGSSGAILIKATPDSPRR
jgi:hypothetical protein